MCNKCGSKVVFSEEYGYDCSNVKCENHCQTELEEERVLEDALNGRR